MPFTPDQTQRIIATLQEKKVTGNCRCGTSQWTLGPDIVLLQALSLPGQAPIALGVGLPSVALVCTNCGNTQLYNVFVTGINRVLGMEPLPGN
jgi:hypothetical protein